jgi:ATP-dependent helicase/nuclease subunit B
MKIFFSTLFDSSSYPLNIFLENGVAIGAIHLGPTGLLHFLELHLGIPAPETNTIQRIFQYRQALQQNKEPAFYKKSFEANALDSASVLLHWRDELKMAGWDFKADKTTPKRLADLAQVENKIQPGFADRYRQVYQEIKRNQTIPLEEVVLHEPFDLLPPFYQQLFSLFKESGIKVQDRNPGNSPNQADHVNHIDQGSDLALLQDMVLNKHHPKKRNTLQIDGSIQILQFGEQLSAANGVAALIEQDPSFQPVIINESGDTSLALALRERGIPYTGQALHAVSHPDLQLLAVMPVWLWKPYPPQQLLDFLLCPFNILPERLCLQWADDFSENPGICKEEWFEKIETYTAKIEDEKARSKPADRLNYLLNVAVEQQERISVQKVAEYYQYFYNIFNARCAVTKDEQERSRLTRLCGVFKSFIVILADYPEVDIDPLDLQQLISLVLKPVSIVPYEKEADSLHEIAGPGLLTGDCQDLLWFGFTASQSTHAIWSHWSGEELDWLAKRNVYLDSGRSIAKRQFFFLTQWLRFVKGRIIFVIPSVVNGELAQLHSFQPFLDACFDKLHEITVHIEQPGYVQLLKKEKVKTDYVPFSPVPNFPGYWNLQNSHLLARRDKPESFNSLQKLLKYPYQWVLTYKAGLKRGKTLCLPSLHMFYGNLSHEVFQRLLMMIDILTINQQELKGRYTRIVFDLIEQKGLLLHTTGQEEVLRAFREYLFDKFLVLLQHIKSNGWKVEDCEITRSRRFGDEEIEGRCDLLLTRKKGREIQKAIIDLKYQGERKYRLLMTGTEDLQLAIYSRIFHPLAQYCPTAYFIIRQGILFTSCADAFKTGHIVNQKNYLGETYGELLKKMEETIRFRREELAQGRIEVGEAVPAEALEVFRLDPETYILPQTKTENKVPYKARLEYNDYTTFIDTE